MLGRRAFQIAEGLQGKQFAVLDLTGRGGQIGAGVFQRSETGAGTVSGNFDDHALPLCGLTDDALFVGGVRGFAVDFQQALFLQQAFDQRRAEFGADGVGALNA